MKKLVLVEQGKYIGHDITLKKHAGAKNAGIDIVRFNWYTDDDVMADYGPKDVGGEIIRCSQGRDFLMSKVIDKYEYIMYTDEDTYIESYNSDEEPWQLLMNFLEEWQPLAVNIHTPNIWCRDGRILNKISEGEPCIVRKHDACNMILRNDICRLVHPIKYHGSDAVTHYQQYLCHKLRPQHYLSPPNLIAVNGIEEQHYHVDDRQTNYKDGILKKFANDLKEPDDFYPTFTSDGSVTNSLLVQTEPLKNAPELTSDEYHDLFKTKEKK